jgi:hypothetical protein
MTRSLGQELSDLQSSISLILRGADRLDDDDRERISRYERRIDEINRMIMPRTEVFVRENLPYTDSVDFQLARITVRFGRYRTGYDLDW